MTRRACWPSYEGVHERIPQDDVDEQSIIITGMQVVYRRHTPYLDGICKHVPSTLLLTSILRGATSKWSGVW